MHKIGLRLEIRCIARVLLFYLEYHRIVPLSWSLFELGYGRISMLKWKPDRSFSAGNPEGLFNLRSNLKSLLGISSSFWPAYCSSYSTTLTNENTKSSSKWYAARLFHLSEILTKLCLDSCRRSIEPLCRIWTQTAQTQASCAIPQLLFHGCKMSRCVPSRQARHH